jgi:hypothetical protein
MSPNEKLKLLKPAAIDASKKPKTKPSSTSPPSELNSKPNTRPTRQRPTTL